MNKILKIFLQHPEGVGETYLEHCFRSLKTIMILLLAQIALLVHAFFPFLFVHTASNKLKSIIEEIPES